MIEEDKIKRREWAKRHAVEVTLTAEDIRRALDGTNEVALLLKSQKVYDFYKSFYRYLSDTKEELWERMEKAGLTDYDAEKLLAFNGGLRLKGKPFMSDVQEQWVKEWLDMHKKAIGARDDISGLQKKSEGKKGRRKRKFADLLLEDGDGQKLSKLHSVIKGQKGKAVALIILACMKKGWMIEKPTFSQVKEEFGNIGVQQGFTSYLREGRFTREEIEGAINSLCK